MSGKHFLGPLNEELNGLADDAARLLTASNEGGINGAEHVTADLLVQRGDASDEALNAINEGKVALFTTVPDEGLNMGDSRAFWNVHELGMSLITLKAMMSSIEGTNVPLHVATSERLVSRVAGAMSSLAPPPNGVVYGVESGLALTPMRTIARFNGEIVPSWRGSAPALQRLVDSLGEDIKYVIVTDVMNVLSEPNVELLSEHIRLGRMFTCELVDRSPADSKLGSIAWHDGVIRGFMPSDFTDDSFVEKFTWSLTGTYVIDAAVVRDLMNRDVPYTMTRFKCKGTILDAPRADVLRFIGEYDTSFVLSPRTETCFFVNDYDDLEVVGSMLNRDSSHVVQCG